MNKFVVYSVITSGWKHKHVLPSYDHYYSDVDYICFTDIKDLRGDGSWDVRYSKKCNYKAVKILSHKYVQDYDFTVYADASIKMLCHPRVLIKRMNHGIGTFTQGLRDCAYEEAEMLLNVPEGDYRCPTEEDKALVKAKLTYLADEKYPHHNGQSSCGFIIRDSSAEIIKFNKLWWRNLNRFLKRRDQVLFNYCLWKLGIELDWFGNIRHNKFVKWCPFI